MQNEQLRQVLRDMVIYHPWLIFWLWTVTLLAVIASLKSVFDFITGIVQILFTGWGDHLPEHQDEDELDDDPKDEEGATA